MKTQALLAQIDDVINHMKEMIELHADTYSIESQNFITGRISGMEAAKDIVVENGGLKLGDEAHSARKYLESQGVDNTELKESAIAARDRLRAEVNNHDESCSAASAAADLLRAEAERLGGLRTERPIQDDLRWVYSVAAAWLDCRNDPSTIRRWQEIPNQNAEGDAPAELETAL